MSERFGLRRAAEADVGGIRRLIESAFTPYIERIGRPPAPMSVDYGTTVRDAVVWVCVRGPEIVGVLVTEPRADHLFVDTVAVSPGEQGTGLGRLLLRQAEIEAAQRDLAELRLYTNEAMAENLAFYPRLGYVETGRRTEEGFRRVFFTKRLDP